MTSMTRSWCPKLPGYPRLNAGNGSIERSFLQGWWHTLAVPAPRTLIWKELEGLKASQGYMHL